MSAAASRGAPPVGMPGLVITVCMIGDTLLYAVLPTLYHQEFGLSLAMVGVLLSLNRWIACRQLRRRPFWRAHRPASLMIAGALGSAVSTTVG